MHFFYAASWGLVVLIGLVGWGRGVDRLLRPNQPGSVGLSGAIGFSLSTFFGGILGLAHLIRPLPVIALIVLGVVLAVIDGVRRPAQCWRGLAPGFGNVLLLAVVGFTGCRYLASARTVGFQPLDDLPGYVVFPVKMLQTGNFAPDPYSDRRLSGLGGQPWSQALVLAALDTSAINLLDHGIALVLFIALVGSWLLSIGMGLRATQCIQLVIALVSPRYLNVASFVTISLLVLAIFVLLTKPNHSVRGAILLALVTGAVCSLKGTCVPFVGTMLTLYFLGMAVSSRSARPLIFAAITVLFILVFLVPWMYQNQLSCGTPLFPFLGKGTSQLPDLSSTVPKRVLVALLGLSMVPAAEAALLWRFFQKNATHRAWTFPGAMLLLAMTPIIFVVGVKTGGAGWMRYSQPFLYGLMPVALAALWLFSESVAKASRPVIQAISVFVWLMLVGLPIAWEKPYGLVTSLQNQVMAIRAGFNNSPDDWSPQDVKNYRALQATVEPGATILAHLDLPILLDFGRNRVFIADHPGLAGPSPGLPLQAEPEAMRAYLKSHGVRYVALNYRHKFGFTEAIEFDPTDPYLWNRLCSARGLAFQQAMMQLAKSYPVVFNDGWRLVLDLR